MENIEILQKTLMKLHEMKMSGFYNEERFNEIVEELRNEFKANLTVQAGSDFLGEDEKELINKYLREHDFIFGDDSFESAYAFVVGDSSPLSLDDQNEIKKYLNISSASNDIEYQKKCCFIALCEGNKKDYYMALYSLCLIECNKNINDSVLYSKYFMKLLTLRNECISLGVPESEIVNLFNQFSTMNDNKIDTPIEKDNQLNMDTLYKNIESADLSDNYDEMVDRYSSIINLSSDAKKVVIDRLYDRNFKFDQESLDDLKYSAVIFVLEGNIPQYYVTTLSYKLKQCVLTKNDEDYIREHMTSIKNSKEKCVKNGISENELKNIFEHYGLSRLYDSLSNVNYLGDNDNAIDDKKVDNKIKKPNRAMNGIDYYLSGEFFDTLKNFDQLNNLDDSKKKKLVDELIQENSKNNKPFVALRIRTLLAGLQGIEPKFYSYLLECNLKLCSKAAEDDNLKYIGEKIPLLNKLISQCRDLSVPEKDIYELLEKYNFPHAKLNDIVIRTDEEYVREMIEQKKEEKKIRRAEMKDKRAEVMSVVKQKAVKGARKIAAKIRRVAAIDVGVAFASAVNKLNERLNNNNNNNKQQDISYNTFNIDPNNIYDFNVDDVNKRSK